MWTSIDHWQHFLFLIRVDWTGLVARNINFRFIQIQSSHSCSRGFYYHCYNVASATDNQSPWSKQQLKIELNPHPISCPSASKEVKASFFLIPLSVCPLISTLFCNKQHCSKTTVKSRREEEKEGGGGMAWHPDFWIKVFCIHSNKPSSHHLSFSVCLGF